MGERFQGKWSGQPLTFTVGRFRLNIYFFFSSLRPSPPPVRHVTNAPCMHGMRHRVSITVIQEAGRTGKLGRFDSKMMILSNYFLLDRVSLYFDILFRISERLLSEGPSWKFVDSIFQKSLNVSLKSENSEYWNFDIKIIRFDGKK